MAPPPAPQTMKERILETADKLFYLQGIRAIGVDTIAAEIGITPSARSTTTSPPRTR
ncbi:AcrR family transcriptional regulator [Bradyrhizobium sp. LB7.2]